MLDNESTGATSQEGASAHTSPASQQGAPPAVPTTIMFVAPEVTAPPPRPRTNGESSTPSRGGGKDHNASPSSGGSSDSDDSASGDNPNRRRRGRRGRGRGRGSDEPEQAENSSAENQRSADAETTKSENDKSHASKKASGSAEPQTDEQADESKNAEQPKGSDAAEEVTSTSRRRRRRRRGTDPQVGSDNATSSSDHDTPSSNDEVQGTKGSARLEAKRQRRRDGREHRRRSTVLTEAEFLARRESVERVMAVRQRGELTQIAVLEDDILVEHYATRAVSSSLVGGVYLGRVQNVLPSMEAAFVDIGKGRNAVLYAGEVNWDIAGMEGKPRKIEQALKSGDTVMVQVTKDPIGHKGARLTSQISLPGRFLVYVPGNEMTGISRKLPDTERKRLKEILKAVVPPDAGVIVRTAAEGVSEEELSRDVARLAAQWETIQNRAGQNSVKSSAPTQLYSEPDLIIRVIRDIFNEDFTKLIVHGDASEHDAWELVEQYVGHVSPELVERLSHHTAQTDLFADLRVDEQLTKALDRKVWLPSGGSLVIDRTEAMTVIDVNTGRFTGQGGSLEETVTRNNLEAAEEIVRQLRLRDIGGIIVIDFIDMVLESNRDLVLRRLTECLGRDRTRHQVAEVTSLGLVQMTRKRVGQGLLEVFSEPCDHCRGRGVVVHSEPLVEHARQHHHTPQQRWTVGGCRQERQAALSGRAPAGSSADR